MASRFPRARNYLTAIALTAAMGALPIAAFAQDQNDTPPKQQKKPPEAPSKLPKIGADRTRGLDFLFGALKAAPDEASAKPVEAWNRGATLYYLQNDYARSLVDIEQVLVREPRHFGALAGLGMIMQDLGDEKRALDAFRKALAINPHLEKVPELVKTLSEKVEGRDI